MEIDYSKYYWKNDIITLRQPKADDWEYQVRCMFDSQARFFFNEEIEMPTDVEKYKKMFTENDNKDMGFICFAIENNDGRHVGICNLFGVNERNGIFGPIGIQIDADERGKGYGTAAFRMLGRYMFNERRMHKWNSEYIEGNAGSAALHKKIGFEIEGVRKDIYFHNGRYWNTVIVGMTEKQFFENNK
ncbi:MAG: GNAT family N-acetyltransferase [Oscillospiraceae bacterium]|nr:GNAT family N-acetyltransferase [Oscillospiraceae bacterium]